MEVGPIGPELFSSQAAREERWEAPTSEKARGKVRAEEVPPLEMDEAMAQCLQ